VKTIAFIDGFNVYHSLDRNLSYHKYKWLNYRRLIECFLLSGDELVSVLCFTTPTRRSELKRIRQSAYLKVLEHNGVEIKKGEFFKTTRQCPHCDKKYRPYVEKLTDVNLASHLIKMAVKDDYEKAIIMTADTDIIPAILAVQELKPTKTIEIIYPIGRTNGSIGKMKIKIHHTKEHHLSQSVFPDNVNIGNEEFIHKPQEWSGGSSSLYDRVAWYIRNIRRETDA
jgi:uncharacterized LabA/DUF88 family protein